MGNKNITHFSLLSSIADASSSLKYRFSNSSIIIHSRFVTSTWLTIQNGVYLFTEQQVFTLMNLTVLPLT